MIIPSYNICLFFYIVVFLQDCIDSSQSSVADWHCKVHFFCHLLPVTLCVLASCHWKQMSCCGFRPVQTCWLLLCACMPPSIQHQSSLVLCHKLASCLQPRGALNGTPWSIILPSYQKWRRAFLEEVDKVFFAYSWEVPYHKWQCLPGETSHPALAVSQTVPIPASHTPYLSLTGSRCVCRGWLVVALCCQGTMPQSCISPPHGLHLPFSAWLSPICCPLPCVGGQQMGQKTGTQESKFFSEARRESVRSEKKSLD